MPVVLLKQWQAEIKKIGGGKLKVIEHHTTTLGWTTSSATRS